MFHSQCLSRYRQRPWSSGSRWYWSHLHPRSECIERRNFRGMKQWSTFHSIHWLPRFFQTLKVLQIQLQRLTEENRSIKEENKTLRAEKPKQKRCVDMQHELSMHEDTITIYARKYGMMVEMFPSGELLNKKLPESPTPFNSSKQYTTEATQDSAFLDELYCHFPESVHKVMETSYFSDLVCGFWSLDLSLTHHQVLKCIPDAHANEIKKLCGVAGDIFNLPSKYFTKINFERATIPEIQQLLGVTSAMDLAYKIFPPVLFPGLKDDKSLKTVFSNWELLARVSLLLCTLILHW